MKKALIKIYQFLGSLKFAVIVILFLAILSAIGTFVETRYNAEIAKKLVYDSPWMAATMIGMVFSLTLSAIQRIPWQRKHIPFLVVHSGIIIIIIGSVITKEFGLDGSMVLPLNDKENFVLLPNTDLSIFSSFDGQNYSLLWGGEVDFFLDSPKDNPIVVRTQDDPIEIVDYIPFATAQEKYVEVQDSREGPAIRFQLKNQMVEVSEWMHLRAGNGVEYNLGPAKVVLTKGFYDHKLGESVIAIRPERADKAAYYWVYSKDGEVQEGKITQGDVIQTGWMGLEFKLLKVYQYSRREMEFTEQKYPSEVTTSAVKVKYGDQERWMQLNSVTRFFSDTAAYVLTYGNRRVDIGFPIFLKDFRLGNYPGLKKAMSYESEVMVPDKGNVVISMNEPLKLRGYTFYQASFNQDRMGATLNSVLSVNYDPGRGLKYFGSILLVAGSILLFYFRKYYTQKKVSA